LVPVATGLIVAGDVNDPTTKERPAPNGFSIGHPDITAGTLGMIVKNAAGDRFIMSNNHVLANSNDANIGDASLQPGPFDGGTSADQIGTLADFVPIDFSGANNTVDAAISSVNGSDVTASTPSYAYGPPGTATTTAFVGQGVQKFGRTTGHTTGTVAETNVTVDVCYETRGPFMCAKLARFVDQFTVSDGSFSDGGDSGSLIVTDDANANPVGLLFAGSSTRTIANPIDDALNAFGVAVTTDPGSGTGNNPPTASFTSSCTDLTCDFDGSGSSDSDGTITAYDWDFGDGNTASGVTVSHTYAAGGTYTVTLTVTDDDGATGSDSQSVTVTDPGGSFTLSTTGYKVRGLQKADLTWSGASGTDVDILRDGVVIATTANDGFYTDNIDQRGGGSYVYQVCEAGTSTCSNTSTVVF
ncbi:MAG: PKD domain-containing protein, partial [Gemmatimonadota bacterium]|nr:PKD domain-containing protein [Gemmatimonadota bacterium]